MSQELAPDLVRYFIENENDVERLMERYDASPNTKLGRQFLQVNFEGKRLAFDFCDFILFQKNKHIYTSPLYKALFMTDFKDGHNYKVRLLRDMYGHYGIPYGKAGDEIILRHSKRYSTYGKLCVVEGHGYGTNFELGKDIEFIEEVPYTSTKRKQGK